MHRSAKAHGTCKLEGGLPEQQGITGCSNCPHRSFECPGLQAWGPLRKWGWSPSARCPDLAGCRPTRTPKKTDAKDSDSPPSPVATDVTSSLPFGTGRWHSGGLSRPSSERVAMPRPLSSGGRGKGVDMCALSNRSPVASPRCLWRHRPLLSLYSEAKHRWAPTGCTSFSTSWRRCGHPNDSHRRTASAPAARSFPLWITGSRQASDPAHHRAVEVIFRAPPHVSLTPRARAQ